MTLTFRFTTWSSNFRASDSFVLSKTVRSRIRARTVRGDYGNSLAAPVNHSAAVHSTDGDRRSAPNVGVPEQNTDEREEWHVAVGGPERDGQHKRARRRPRASGTTRNDSRGFLAIFNGFSTEPPRVRTRCGFVTGEVSRRRVFRRYAMLTSDPWIKIEEKTPSVIAHEFTSWQFSTRPAFQVLIDDSDVTIREKRGGTIAFL